MSEPAEDPARENEDAEVQDKETEDSKYRSFYDDTNNRAKLKQKFKIGRVVWFKTDTEGSFRMTVMDAEHTAANTWRYKLTDSLGSEHEGWVAETRLTAANPSTVEPRYKEL